MVSTIDLIILGIVKQESLSAYDIQKRIENRNISRWVKISTPSVYKKVLQLESKGFLKSTLIKNGKMAEKSLYSLTEQGELEFENLMYKISLQPVNIFLDLNAVILNLESLSGKKQRKCIAGIEENIIIMKDSLEESMNAGKDDISLAGKAVLDQQYLLVKSMLEWMETVKNNTKNEKEKRKKKS